MRLRQAAVAVATLLVVAAVTGALADRPEPEGGTIVFSSARGGPPALWEVAVGTKRLRRLTDPHPPAQPCRWCANGDADAQPVWAEGGDRVAFTRGPSVIVRSLLGERETMVSAPATAEDTQPTWSNGGRLAFARRIEVDGSLRHQIVTVGADGRDQSVLVRTGQFATPALAWSPDGRRLAYVAAYRDPAVRFVVGLFVVPATGGPPRFLMRAAGMADIAWAPDGRTLVLSATEPGGETFDPLRIFSITIDDRRIVQLTRPRSSVVGDRTPRWSPDGSRIAFVRTGRFGSAVHTVRPDGSGRRLVARDATGPTWSPTGRSLAFVAGYSGRRGPLTLSVVAASGGEPRRMVTLRHPTDGRDLGPQAWH
ncbi:MAG: TolB family protein [Gaiella sp.]